MKTQGKVASIPYTLERRRTSRLISVRVLGDGTVKVNAPYRVSVAAIERVLVSHQETLRQAISTQKMHLHTYQSGDTFLFGGKRYCLELKQGAKNSIAVIEERLVVTHVGKEAEALVVQHLVKTLYRQSVKARVEPLLSLWAKRLEVVQPPFSVRDSKSRWGSCSAKGRLNFSLRCQILDDRQLSYLVLHEMAHLVHFNHSKEFHALLALHMSPYKEIQASIFALQKESQLHF
ncbi:M48 family metallopeptidase [Sphaerochaeta globosa]|uniref:YgjP-like metallopeptidase domain-containing protein n=1 Tax=Sphaerochaeta globosa (strain ATCC BAA-1886 / DSM 22777 / Buddy) TaxID=158189 RepID=F0RZV2_SPHGB|nr:SprT family zinc-dependent metalloprotease [Sphaerochaeta globosa]ADY14853.1 protein of unknown function DUF45 [Sphaerochaeta globosa str. Buddy]